MAPLSNDATAAHDFSSISPSAYTLLIMKGDTNIPFAREATKLLKQAASDQYQEIPNFGATPVDYWTRVLHFESRYWSIDQLLEDQPYTNILELSSGFSFRGLALSRQKPVFYIDTDLEAVIAGKQKFIDALTEGETAPNGHYELQTLNVLDSTAFKQIIARFPPGPIAIVNEGLLIYLATAEKERLCQNILETLRMRGGCWITADIYFRRPQTGEITAENDPYQQWQAQHKIEENKFKDKPEAEAFFQRMGFVIDKEAKPNYERLSSLARLRETNNATVLDSLRQPGRPRLHATWRLKTEAALY